MQAIKMKTPGFGGNAGAKEMNHKTHCFRLGANSQMPTLNANEEGVS